VFKHGREFVDLEMLAHQGSFQGADRSLGSQRSFRYLVDVERLEKEALGFVI
jgi:hypothetical protein